MEYVVFGLILAVWLVLRNHLAKREKNSLESLSRSAKETAAEVQRLQVGTNERFQVTFAKLAVASEILNLSKKAQPVDGKVAHSSALLFAARRYSCETSKQAHPAVASKDYLSPEKQPPDLSLKHAMLAYGAGEEFESRDYCVQMRKKKQKDGISAIFSQIPSYSHG